MTTTRKGKIARLPLAIRTQLNQRLSNGECARKLIAWLNTLPEVQAILAAGFGAQPINEPNFTAWRKGGFKQWLQEQEARRLARELGGQVLAGNPESRDTPPLSESLSWWVMANYCVNREMLTEAKGDRHWKLLREMCKDVVALRRADHQTQRLGIEREWQQITRERKQHNGLPRAGKAIKRSLHIRFPTPKLKPT